MYANEGVFRLEASITASSSLASRLVREKGNEYTVRYGDNVQWLKTVIFLDVDEPASWRRAKELGKY